MGLDMYLIASKYESSFRGDIKYPEALKELEEVVAKLEGNIALDEAVKEFQKGIELSKVLSKSISFASN